MTVYSLSVPAVSHQSQDPGGVSVSKNIATTVGKPMARVFPFPVAETMKLQTQRVTPTAAAVGCDLPGLKAKKVKQRERCVPGVPMLKVVTYIGTGGEVYVFRFVSPDSGKRNSVMLGSTAEISFIEVVARVKALRDDIREGRSPKAAAMLVDEFVAEYFRPWAKDNKKSWRDDISRYQLHWATAIGSLPLNEVDGLVCKRVIDALRNGNRSTGRGRLSPASINRVAMVARTIFRLAVDMGLLGASPALGLRNVKEVIPPIRVLSSDEQDRLGRALVDATPLLRLLIELLMCSAMRIGEALNARYADVDRLRNGLHLPETKSGVPQFVPLPAWILASIAEHEKVRRNEYIFPAIRGEGPMSRPRKALQKLLAEAGIENFSFHGFRKTAATEAMACPGVTIMDASKLLRHRSIRTTELHYINTSDERLHNAVTQVGELVHRRLQHGQAIRPALLPAVRSVKVSGDARFITSRIS